MTATGTGERRRALEPAGLIDTERLEREIKAMYTDVARDPGGEFHFEMGRGLAERLGYARGDLDAVPPAALASFAGVGHFFDLAGLRPGERVLDLGSGSGTDVFVAAARVGRAGRVIGVDMTEAQLAKARRLAVASAAEHVEFREGYIEDPPVADGGVDAVISNGVINLSPDKRAVFRAVARALRPGGRLALADIVSARPLALRTRANTSLWAACIAGAIPREDYLAAVEAAGLRVRTVRENAGYRFIGERAVSACAKYGVESVSLLAVKP